MRYALLILLLACIDPWVHAQDSIPPIADKIESMEAFEGYFDFFWDETEGKIWLRIDRWDEEFLYVHSLTAALGSNDIGLDRNQLGNQRVVYFQRVGPKVLLIQPNYDYRAETDNAYERRAVEEAFTRSVLAGFRVKAETGDAVLVDFTPFLMRDAHGVARRLKAQKQGTFKLDEDRSAPYLERTKNFPMNSEWEVTLTFAGDVEGAYLRSVSPSNRSITVRQHHSFVQLPDDDYQARAFDPRSGYYPLSFRDYASPIDQPLTTRWITRHRLKKKNPKARRSEAVEPIVYYLDPGVPEPIRSALLEGAAWWNQAFEAAGYVDAFQVEVLPEGADPMDVRYNVINWTHRATRGWSYGTSVTDPRTGEIIKGHVLLGSLRVRQDFLIAQGLIDAYADGKTPDPRMEAMALARLRQLSAHEVGHTLGLTHNFAASYNDRASVMDYPHPYVTLDDNGKLDLSKAYDTGIGEWDKRTILYGYQDFPEGTDAAAALQEILRENREQGFQFISDRDARPQGGAHPYAHLWDNGQDPVAEFERLATIRKQALASFDEQNIPEGMPMAELERVLVPLYFAHRYQVEAVAKWIGGLDYAYAVRGDGQARPQLISRKHQDRAIAALVSTLQPEFLALPESVIQLIPPQPMGYSRDRELFKTYDGMTFDPLAAAEGSIEHSLNLALDPHRLARMLTQYAIDSSMMAPSVYLRSLWKNIKVDFREQSAYHQQLRMIAEKRFIMHLMQLAADSSVNPQVAAAAFSFLYPLDETMITRQSLFRNKPEMIAHLSYIQVLAKQFLARPSEFKLPPAKPMPPGSPIGCGH